MCEPVTPAVPRLSNHHELVEGAVKELAAEQKIVRGGLGSASGARYRAYERLKRYTLAVKGTLPTLRVSLAKFFRFVAQVEKISRLEDIGPAAITRIIAHELELGLTGRHFVGHLSTFLGSLIAEGRFNKPNPVVQRIQSQRGAPTAPRTYCDAEMTAILESVEKTENLQLMLVVTKRVMWHTFRHSLASFLGRSGENVKTVQELLRHAGSRLAQDVYQQGNTEAKRLALGRVAGIFADPNDKS